MTMRHLTQEELSAGLADILRSPKDGGALRLIVRRPDIGRRETVKEAQLDSRLGLVGDTWHVRASSRTEDGSPHPDMQLNIMNARAIALLAQSDDRWPLAGDQLFLDLDLTDENLPAGTRLQLGSAVIQVTPQPHTGCGKFSERFGVDAMKFVNAPEGRRLHLRGINARVVRSGTVRVGDVATKLLAALALCFAVTIPLMAQDRMPPIPAAQQTPEQRAAVEAFRANRKQDPFGPFVPLLRSPEVMLRAMAMGDHLRYRTVFPPKLNELIIILTARHFTQQYEWSLHQPIALKEGLAPEIADAIAAGLRPVKMAVDEELIYDFCTELLRDHGVSDPTYARAIARFGEQGTTEMVSVVGYYTFLAMVLNTARTPVTPNAPTLAPLTR